MAKEKQEPPDLADQLYASCLDVLRKFHSYLDKELEHCGLEEESVSVVEDAIENFYLWGNSLQGTPLGKTLGYLSYLKEDVLDALCRIGKLTSFPDESK